jgi:hypothetical protein
MPTTGLYIRKIARRRNLLAARAAHSYVRHGVMTLAEATERYGLKWLPSPASGTT